MADVLRATYADLKTVKTRSSCQIILEMPIEALTDVVALLGAPVPGEEVWVAVARLKPEAAVTVIAPERKPLSQVAAVLGGLQPFRRFLSERMGRAIVGPDEAAVAVRELCGVASRKALDTDAEAASAFRNLRTDYDNWMHGVEAAA